MFGVDPSTLPKYGKVEDDPDLYFLYIKSITGYSACPICNGPMSPLVFELPQRNKIYIPEQWRFVPGKTRGMYSRVTCIRFPSHASVARRPIKNWKRELGQLCDDGYYQIEHLDWR